MADLVGGTGLEQPAKTSEKPTISVRGAKIEANLADDEALQSLALTWPTLPAEIRRAILKLADVEQPARKSRNAR